MWWCAEEMVVMVADGCGCRGDGGGEVVTACGGVLERWWWL